MKIEIKDKTNGQAIMSIKIPYSQNPIEAVLNWCDNMGYRYMNIEWEAK